MWIPNGPTENSTILHRIFLKWQRYWIWQYITNVAFQSHYLNKTINCQNVKLLFEIQYLEIKINEILNIDKRFSFETKKSFWENQFSRGFFFIDLQLYYLPFPFEFKIIFSRNLNDVTSFLPGRIFLMWRVQMLGVEGW